MLIEPKFTAEDLNEGDEVRYWEDGREYRFVVDLLALEDGLIFANEGGSEFAVHWVNYVLASPTTEVWASETDRVWPMPEPTGSKPNAH